MGYVSDCLPLCLSLLVIVYLLTSSLEPQGERGAIAVSKASFTEAAAEGKSPVIANDEDATTVDPVVVESFPQDLNVTNALESEPKSKEMGFIECTHNTTQPRTVDCDQGLFLHVGKAGGGSVRYRVRSEWFIRIHHSHPAPHTLELIRRFREMPSVLISVRDPVDRYLSAVHHRIKVLCNVEGETREPGNALMFPDEKCEDLRPWESEILNVKYRKSANLLAELLYDEEKGEEARNDIGQIRHAQAGLSEWMDYDWKNHTNKLYVVVLEKPFDIVRQVDEFVGWLYDTTKFEDPVTFGQRKAYAQQLYCESKGKPDDLHAHKSQAHETLSPKAIRNVARYYRSDYDLLAELKEFGCKNLECEQSIQSILDRRADLIVSIDDEFFYSN